MDPMGIILERSKRTHDIRENFLSPLHIGKVLGWKAVKQPSSLLYHPTDSQPTNWHRFALDERLPSLKKIWQKRPSEHHLLKNSNPPKQIKITLVLQKAMKHTSPTPQRKRTTSWHTTKQFSTHLGRLLQTQQCLRFHTYPMTSELFFLVGSCWFKGGPFKDPLKQKGTPKKKFGCFFLRPKIVQHFLPEFCRLCNFWVIHSFN